MLEIMIKEERRVARLIDDLLDLGRIRSGQLELELSSFDLCELVREVGAQMQVRWRAQVDAERRAAGAGGGTLGSIAAQSGRYESGRQRRQVRTGTPRDHSAAGDNQRTSARLEVTDNGLGIAPELHGRIFEPFKRA